MNAVEIYVFSADLGVSFICVKLLQLLGQLP